MNTSQNTTDRAVEREHPPGPTASNGFAEGVMDFVRLLRELLVIFAKRIVNESMKEPIHPLDIHEFASDHQWTTAYEDLTEWTDRVEQPPEAVPRWSYQEVISASDLGEDLLFETGVRAQWLGEMQETRQECLSQLQAHLHRIARAMSHRLGTASALAWLSAIRAQYELELDRYQTSENRWSLAWRDEVQDALDECQASSRPDAWWRRLLGRCFPSLAAIWILGRFKKLRMEGATERLEAALQVRHQDDLATMKLEILDELLGRGNRPGVIAALMNELRQEHEAGVEKILAALDAYLPAAPAAASDCCISFIEDLRTPFDRRGTTLFDLYHATLRRLGILESALADELRPGLNVNGRMVPSGEWIFLPPTELAASLMGWLEHRLGTDAPRVNVDSPRTFLDHLAAITPAHPALRERAEQVMHLIKQRSAPYYEVEPPLLGVKPHTSRYLYCYGPHRAFWLELLGFSTKTHLDPHQGGDLSEFNLVTPYRIVLAQYSLNLPGQAHPTFLRGAFRARQLQRSGFPLIFDMADWREFRQVPRRPTNPSALRDMFEGLLTSGEVYPIAAKSDRYLPSRIDPGYESMFRERHVTAAAQPAEFWAKAVRHGNVRRWITQTVQPDTDLTKLFHELSNESHLEAVVKSLEQQGIITQLAGMLFALNGPIPEMIEAAPAGLYEKNYGNLVGMSRPDFLSYLGGSEGFFTVFYFRLFDAIAEGRLNRARAPLFLQNDLLALGV